ncbi:phasin [Citreicella sp. C3M06]|uniref:phasin n=1 Tax=Citreicella sp. C3M06 TaxID=2841564 RepID=UPI001C095F9C|nr:phasin [Citreicella sp. C3M06]MBU2962654.1 phasin [Citreicella sp. C3M06]
MAMTEDFTAKMKDMMGAFPMDSAKLEEAWKSSAAYSEKATSIAIEAASKSTDISVGFTMETLGRIGELAKAKPEAADYAQAMTDFASAQMSSLQDNMTALGEVAKTMQADTMELIMSMGKEMADEASATTTTVAKATTPPAAPKTASAAKTTTRRTTAAAKATAQEATPSTDS